MPRTPTDNPEREFLPLRTLAEVLTILLACDVALTAVRLGAQLLSSETPAQTDLAIKPVVIVARICVAVTEIVFLVWLRRARINAERFAWQRRARAWVFWGWIIPIGDLWIPFQIVGDIWRAGLQPERRYRVAWLPALWWTSFLLVKPAGLIIPGGASTRSDYGLLAPANGVSFALYAMAGIMLLAIVRIVSGGQVGSPARHATA